jgi:hypothetical protein
MTECPCQEEIKVLINSAPNLDPFIPQKGGIYLGDFFKAILGPDTKLKTSDYPWVDQETNTIVLSKIPYVNGTVDAKYYSSAGSQFCTFSDENYRFFKGNGLPSTPMGIFPIQVGTSAYPYYVAAPGGRNPCTNRDYSSAAAIPVCPYDLDITLTRHPRYNDTPQPINSLIIGVTLTGQVWHAEIANASQDAWYNPISILPLDECFGHPYTTQYHLHAYSWKCLPGLGTEYPSPLVGYALDGFGIYGPYDKDGNMITNEQLDECHGLVSEVMWEGKLTMIYHYVLNNEYPYCIGAFRGDVNYDLALGNTPRHSPHGAGISSMSHGEGEERKNICPITGKSFKDSEAVIATLPNGKTIKVCCVICKNKVEGNYISP